MQAGLAWFRSRWIGSIRGDLLEGVTTLSPKTLRTREDTTMPNDPFGEERRMVLTMVTDKSWSQLDDELKEAARHIEELRRERDEQATLVAQMREQIADYDAMIERWTNAVAKLKASHELVQGAKGPEAVFAALSGGTEREQKTG
jgi:hypothetical protein